MRQGAPLVTYQPRGRLANQMLQCSAAIGYGKTHNVPWGAPRNTKEVPRFHEFFPGLPICENGYRFYQEHPNNDHCHIHNCGRDQCWYNYHPLPFYPGGVTLAGFWQSWKYFDHAQDEVRKAFKLPHYDGYENSMSLHIRLGDYVQHSHAFPPITSDYIRLALQHMPHVIDRRVVFSDDIAGARSMLGTFFPHLSWEYSEGKSELEDMGLMASCKYNIIANSTFSWFAAWLNQTPDKVVVSPSHKRGNWFGMQNGVSYDCIDLVPNDWNQIEFR